MGMNLSACTRDKCDAFYLNLTTLLRLTEANKSNQSKILFYFRTFEILQQSRIHQEQMIDLHLILSLRMKPLLVSSPRLSALEIIRVPSWLMFTLVSTITHLFIWNGCSNGC